MIYFSHTLHLLELSVNIFRSTLEIKLLEKKHQEEIKLYQIQIMQHKQQAESIQSKLIQFQEKRVTVAKQLQKVMESQWNEAMRIIANGKSPTFHEEPTTFSTIGKYNVVFIFFCKGLKVFFNIISF